MRKLDKLMLIGIITSLLILLVINIPSSFASEVSNVLFGATTNSEENVTNETVETVAIVSEPDFYVYPEEGLEIKTETFTTKTGLELKIGEIYNPGEEKNVTVKIKVGEKWKVFDILLRENDTWTYGLVNSLLIVPEHSGLVIDPNETNYYKYNNQLKMLLKGSDGKVFVYAKERPTRVVADVSIHWSYDGKENLVIIELLSHSDHRITVDWTLYPLTSGVLYVEDKTELEELEYKESLLEEKLNRYLDLIESLSSHLKELLNITSNLKAEYNKTLEEKNRLDEESSMLSDKITEVNNTKTKLEEKLEGKTVISPLQAIFLGLVLLIIISYIVLFQFERLVPPKGEGKTKMVENATNEVEKTGGMNEV